MKKWNIRVEFCERTPCDFTINDGFFVLQGSKTRVHMVLFKNVTEEQINQMRRLVSGDQYAKTDDSPRKIFEMYLRNFFPLAGGCTVTVKEPIEIDDSEGGIMTWMPDDWDGKL